MPKSPNQKQKLLLIRDYLEKNTDEEHPVSTAELIRYLDMNGVSAERKSIYDDMQTLQDFGVDVLKTRSGNSSGWYVGTRDFQLPELRLLVDSVQASRFITRKKSMELISKLEGLASVHQARDLRRQVFVKNRIKTMNESIYYLVDDIHAAIAADRKIRFKYYTYNARGEKVVKHDGEMYEVSPFALLWDNENYYLVGYDSAKQGLRHYRVDKMAEIRQGKKGRDGREAFESQDMAVYTGARFGMFSGQPSNVRLEFEDSLAGAVIDRFGNDVMLIPGREGHFTVTVSVAVNEPFFAWLCTFGDQAALLGPESARRAMREHIRKISGVYEEAKEEKA
jgi:predicted DNA-binding transcriptional regulator YafY